MILKQILKDLRKEWTWAFFYTVVVTMTAMAIVYLSISFSSVSKQFSFIESFIENNVVMFNLMVTEMERAPNESDSTEKPIASFSDKMNYLQESLSSEGKAGSFVFVGNDGYVDDKYKQILVLFGQYEKLAGLDSSESMALFVPEISSEDVGSTVELAGKEIKVVNTIPSDFSLFHPLHYIEAGSSLLSNTLVLTTKDFKAVDNMFPWWGLDNEAFQRMVLVNPSNIEVEELQGLFYNQFGTLYKGTSTDDFTQITTNPSLRAHRLLMTFYILAGILLIFLLLINTIRMIEVHVIDYTVHHLYGAPISLIQRRVGGFVLVLNILPLIGFIFVLVVNDLAMWYQLPFMILLIAGLYAFAAAYVKRRIGTLNSLQNLRRDY
ncbi:MAG: hypothetical protein GX833_08720 [Clostridium sp.]|nr:hypothetical protein [Clostridium sp.]